MPTNPFLEFLMAQPPPQFSTIRSYSFDPDVDERPRETDEDGHFIIEGTVRIIEEEPKALPSS